MKNKGKTRPEKLIIKNRNMYNGIKRYDRNEMELFLQEVWLDGYIKGKTGSIVSVSKAEAVR